ncbi:putative F-box domain-containing protein [Rosa chinensis]|uniref:Putative F-box domain-containing protein n=1 Tax=Rosa chinensis TaxID=74649 RepID=A0A2P6R494_ROSCH|nr:putative F-box domain-containing protein [Rosa chinensis]
MQTKICRIESSAAETIANIEDLLTQILLRLPARSPIRFQCVSKHWLSLISDPKFRLLHNLQNPNPKISGLFPDTTIPAMPMIIIPLGKAIPSRINRPKALPVRCFDDACCRINILRSCNGLLLCQLHARSTACSGALHWIRGKRSVDNTKLVHFNNLDEERLGSVAAASYHHLSKGEIVYRYFGESGGHLHLIDTYEYSGNAFDVMEMGRDYSGWFVKYHKGHPADEEVLMLHVPGKVVSYNLRSKTVTTSSELTSRDYLLIRDWLHRELSLCVRI